MSWQSPPLCLGESQSHGSPARSIASFDHLSSLQFPKYAPPYHIHITGRRPVPILQLPWSKSFLAGEASRRFCSPLFATLEGRVTSGVAPVSGAPIGKEQRMEGRSRITLSRWLTWRGLSECRKVYRAQKNAHESQEAQRRSFSQ
jgi:hypothetical protein